MRKVAVVAGLALLSTSAFATRARMEALGQDKNGSRFLSDDRSVFLNPAYVNMYKNYVATEWGTDAQASTASDAAGAPQAQGGFFREAGSFAYGVYMGNERVNTRLATTNTYTEAEDNRLDLFFGGDMGVQWGVNVGYWNNEDDKVTTALIKSESNGLTLGLGAIFGNIEGYLNTVIVNDREGSTALQADEVDGDFSWELGLSYNMNAWTFYGEVDSFGEEEKTTAANVRRERSIMAWTLGAAHVHETSEKSRWFTDVNYSNSQTETKVSSPASTTEATTSRIRATVGYESDVKSWLSLRGAVGYDFPILNEIENKVTATATTKQSSNNSLIVTAGSSLHFGDIRIDGMIGTSNSDAAGSTRNTNQGTLSLDQLMTRVAVVYNF